MFLVPGTHKVSLILAQLCVELFFSKFENNGNYKYNIVRKILLKLLNI